MTDQMPTRWLDEERPDADALRARQLLEGFDAAPPPRARAEVWRRLTAEQPRRSPWRIAIPAGAALALAVALIARGTETQAPGSGLGEIAALDGDVQRSTGGGALEPARVGQALATGAQVRTARGGRSRLRLFEIGEVEVGGGTQVAVRGAGERVEVDLAEGEVRATVRPRGDRTPFRVHAGAWTVRVIGTVFTVTRHAEQGVEVSVEKGVVEVEAPEGTFRVAAGERYPARQAAGDSAGARLADAPAVRARAAAPAAPAAPAVPARADAPAPPAAPAPAALAVPAPPAPAAPAPAAPAAPSPPAPAAPAAPARIDAPAAPVHVVSPSVPEPSSVRRAPWRRPPGMVAAHAEPVPPASVAPAGGPAAVPAGPAAAPAGPAPVPAGPAAVPTGPAPVPAGPRATPEIPAAVPAARAEPARPIARPAAVPPSATSEIPPAGSERSAPRAAEPAEPAESKAAEPSARPAEADPAAELKALYAQANRTADPAAALRLFDRVASSEGPFAEIAAHRAARVEIRLARWSDAASRLEHILERFPRGALDQEARLSLLECRLALGETSAARKEVAAFLARYPTSEQQPDLRFLRAELSRLTGHCDAALPEYRAAASTRWKEDALYFDAWCRLKTGDWSGAEDRLRAYLSAYPRGRHAADARSGLSKP